MNVGFLRFAITWIVGLVYWSVFSVATGEIEPWNAAHYWSIAYPLSLLVSAAVGWAFGRGAWTIGLTLTFAQWPLLAVATGIEPLAIFGAALLGALSLPAVLAARLSMAARQTFELRKH